MAKLSAAMKSELRRLGVASYASGFVPHAPVNARSANALYLRGLISRCVVSGHCTLTARGLKALVDHSSGALRAWALENL